MPRTRISYLVALAALVLGSGAGCGFGSGITADSTCGAYLGADQPDRQAAAVRLSTDLHAYSPGNPIWGPSLEAECGATPDTRLRAYFEGQLALDMPSVSMEPTLNVGDKVLVNTLAYTDAAPRRGEVILFKAPDSWHSDPAEARFIKRVIGVGGDRVMCCDPQRRLMVNGRPLDETYLYKNANGESDPASANAFDITVPAGRLWVMGDHRSRSGDSRENYLRIQHIEQATIRVDALVGRAYVVLDPMAHDEPRSLAIPATYADIPDPTS